MSSLHFHPLPLAAVRPAADDALHLQFAVPPALQPVFVARPGQHLTLRAVVDGEELRRSYSLCGAPGEPLQVGVRCLPGGRFGTWLRQAARPGLVLDVMPPQGSFGAALARPAAGRHVLLVGAGSGITPLLGIARAVLASEPASRVTLLYGNRSVASAMFLEALADLKNRWMARLALHLVFSREQMELPVHGGRLDGARLSALLRLAGPVQPQDEAFVCGPEGLLQDAQASLQRAGWAPQQVHTERFGVADGAGVGLAAVGTDPAAGEAAAYGDATAAASHQVHIVRDGITRTVPCTPADASILDAAVRAGLDLPYSCRSGVCATCRARVLRGEVRLLRNFALDAAELQAGHVLACQALPLTPEVVLSFDAR